MKRQKVIPLRLKTELNQRYVIRKKLAEGGFGITYLAEDARGVRYVIKEHFPAWFAVRNKKSARVVPLQEHIQQYEWSLASFLQEASQLSVLNHPNIVRLVDAFEENGTAYYVMPYLSGGDLAYVARRLFTEQQNLSQAAVLSLLRRLLKALEHMHDQTLRQSQTHIYVSRRRKCGAFVE